MPVFSSLATKQSSSHLTRGSEGMENHVQGAVDGGDDVAHPGDAHDALDSNFDVHDALDSKLDEQDHMHTGEK